MTHINTVFQNMSVYEKEILLSIEQGQNQISEDIKKDISVIKSTFEKLWEEAKKNRDVFATQANENRKMINDNLHQIERLSTIMMKILEKMSNAECSVANSVGLADQMTNTTL